MPNTTPPRIAGYARISVDEELDRDNTSIENQKAIISDFLALLKRVTGAVAVLIKHQLRPRKLARDEVRDDGLLVLYRSVVPVKLLINRYARITSNTGRGGVL